MPLFALLLLLGGFGLQPARAQHRAVPDTLHVAAPQPVFVHPARRCRDEDDAAAGTPALAQARCSGAFGAPSVATGRRARVVDEALRVRIMTAITEALDDRRIGER